MFQRCKVARWKIRENFQINLTELAIFLIAINVLELYNGNFVNVENTFGRTVELKTHLFAMNRLILVYSKHGI